MKSDFDAMEEVATIKDYRRMARRKLYRSSRLAPYRKELVEMRKCGATLGDLVLWLRQRKRVRIAASTISRFLRKLPEMEVTNGNV